MSEAKSPAFKVVRYESTDALAQAVAQLLRIELVKIHSAPALIIIPGGTTPHAAFYAVAAEPVRPAQHIFIAYTDERHVPLGAPESNYGLSAPMIAALGLPAERVMRVRTELDLDAAAEVYEADLRAMIANGATIPLALLGIGADGHTCSLFNADDLARSEGHLAIPVRKPAPPDRISITPTVLERAERAIFLAAGKEKATVIQQFIEAPDALIAGRAVKGCAHVELWCA